MGFRASNPWVVGAARSVEWRAVRGQVDLGAVATRLLGPVPGRRGERGRKLWWRCPLGTHEDRNPSFCVTPGKPWWKCWGCGESGDAAALVMRLQGVSFPEAVAYLTGGPARPVKAAMKPASRPAPAPRAETPARPSGMSPEAAAVLVAAASDRLWSPEGTRALAYLTGPRRCLAPETVRAARLGVTPWVSIPRADGTTFQVRGVVVPWFVGDRLALVKIRQPDGHRPKYVEAFRDPARLVCYPGPAAIRPGRPLVVVEGEFDALALGEALGDLATVVTLGGAAARPEPRSLGVMLTAPRWFIATDADEAGETAAAGWPDRARRVRPPDPFKDWTEAKAAGVDLRRWWQEALARGSVPSRLQARGVRLDGRLVFPRIAVGTVTGRVVYTDPALQTMPGRERLARLGPVAEGRRFVRADYGQIEPRILLAILRRRGLINWDAGDDLYRTLAGEAADRDAAKVVVNRVINGGRAPTETTGRLAEFINATGAYRAGLAAEAKAAGFVRTLAGRAIPLPADERNHGGKAVNRVVQGTAADVFNRAVVGVDEALSRDGLSADVAFLLFDELWVECDPADLTAVAALVRSEMETAALELGLSVPVRTDLPSDGPARFTWEQLARWRWGPDPTDSTPGLDNPGRPFNPETYARAMADAADPYNAAERAAIQAEGGPGRPVRRSARPRPPPSHEAWRPPRPAGLTGVGHGGVSKIRAFFDRRQA
jgi:hypothetical protein